MSIIKEAFIEGRETEVDWSESESRKQDVRVQTYLDNMHFGERRKSGDLMPLAQIDPDTGNVVNMFYCRLHACEWVVDNKLTKVKNAISMTGNMEMCMKLGYKSYGYYWKNVSKADVDNWMKQNTKPGAKMVYCKSNKTERVFPSVSAAALALNINPKTLSKRLQKGAIVSIKPHRLQFYNETVQTKIVSSIGEVIAAVGLSKNKNSKSKRVNDLNGYTFNNITYLIDEK